MANDNAKYRYFEIRPCDENNEPASRDGSPPSYLRVQRVLPDHDQGRMPSDFWDGEAWQRSFIQPFDDHISDTLASGAFVREMGREEKGPWNA